MENLTRGRNNYVCVYVSCSLDNLEIAWLLL